jgi:putative salt-induced outer membrane protein
VAAARLSGYQVFMASHARLLVLCLAVVPVPAVAELPEPVRAMIEAAIDGGDPAKVAAVVEVARKTNPDDVAEIDALYRAFRARQAELAAEKKAREEEAIRTAGLFENWKGRGQIGAFHTTGNTDNVGVTLSLAITRTGIDWEHRVRATADLQRSQGRTTREQYLVSYEPRYEIESDLFVYGLGQFERDRFRGFSGRYSVSGGLGYKLLDSQGAQLSIKAGPSWRYVELLDGTSDSSFGGLAGLDFDWQLARNLKLTQDANLVADSGGAATVIVDSTSTSVLLTTGLEARIGKGLSTRLTYTIDYDSNPQPNSVSTDTLSRFTLVYDF